MGTPKVVNAVTSFVQDKLCELEVLGTAKSAESSLMMLYATLGVKRPSALMMKTLLEHTLEPRYMANSANNDKMTPRFLKPHDLD